MVTGPNVKENVLENVRKCKNFLSTLIKLASNQPEETVSNVRNLIQGLIVSVKYFVSLVLLFTGSHCWYSFFCSCYS